jgi:hypothetical protein
LYRYDKDIKKVIKKAEKAALKITSSLRNLKSTSFNKVGLNKLNPVDP